MPSDYHSRNVGSKVDEADILEKLRGIPIHWWSYKNSSGVPHIGPVAQDFRKAFGVGDSDRMIHTVDSFGVALAAIQALEERVRGLEARLKENKDGPR
jgi:hypothetical protein